MKDRGIQRGFCALLLAAAAAASAAATATVADPAPASAAAAVQPSAESDDPDDQDSDEAPPPRVHRHRHGAHGNDVVGIGRDSTLPSGEHADSVVSILGSSTSEGDANDVVSIVGDTKVTGSAADSAVAIVGNTFIDGKVGEAVAVLGNVDLGPHAEVDGDVTAVLGKVRRDPAAIVHGGIQRVDGAGIADLAWLQAWLHHCLFYGRPLALHPDLGWAWGWALGFLALYVLIATVFRSAYTRCVTVVETEPGRAVLTALVALLLAPVAVVVLCVTLVGIAALPFIGLALFCVGLIGKAVMLGWIGRNLAGRHLGPQSHPAAAVLLGGAVVLALYCIPFIGFLVYQLLGFVGFGAVLYALIAHLRARQVSKSAAAAATLAAAPAAGEAAPPPATPPPAGPPPVTPPASAALPRAGFWIRMTALLLDAILVGIVLSLLHPLHHYHLLALAAYGAAMWKTRGSTVGGLIFDLRVVRLDGRPLDWETAIVRALGCFLSAAVAGLGFLWIAFDDAQQAWHDKIAGTVVVRVPKP